MKHLLPDGWPRPKGYSNGISVKNGRTIYIAGLIGWNDREVIESDNLTDQFRKTLENIVAVFVQHRLVDMHRAARFILHRLGHERRKTIIL